MASTWVVRHEFATNLGPLPRWWYGLHSETGRAFGEPEDAEVFGRRIDAEEAFRRQFGRVDPRSRAQRLTEALAEVDVPARLSGTDNSGKTSSAAAPVDVNVGGGSP